MARVETGEPAQEEARKDNEAFKVEMFNLDFPGGRTSNRQA